MRTVAFGGVNQKRAFLTAAVGVALTILCAGADLAGWLNFVESYLYDKRLAWCQHFSLKHHPPVNNIYHLDIDDLALNSIGKWPWPRERIADFVGELNTAGAKVLFNDIVFVDYARDAHNNLDPSGDKVLGEAVGKMGRVLVPMSLQLQELDEAFTPLTREMIAQLMNNPELTDQQLVNAIATLAAKNSALLPPKVDPATLILPKFKVAREEALYRKTTALIDQGISTFAELRSAVLPHIDAMIVSSPLIDVLQEQFDRATREHEMRRFKLPIPESMTRLGKADHVSEQVPIRDISSKAAYSGFVDPFSVGDKRVRAVVLGVESEGMLLPHASLSMACAMLNVDIRKVIFTEQKVSIPLPDGARIDIPVRTARNDSGRPVPLVMDIPWWGTSDWKTMYDWPKYGQSLHHDSINKVGEVIHSREIIEKNTAVLKRAITNMVKEVQPPDDAEKFAKNPPTGEARDRFLADTLDFAKALAATDDASMKDLPTEERNKVQRIKFAVAATALTEQKIADAEKDLITQRAELKKLIDGDLVLVGWTATAAFDFYPTPLHDRCPGVVALSSVVDGILTGRVWSYLPWGLTLVFTLLTGFTTAGLAAFLTPFRSALSTIGLAAAYFVVNGFLVFDYGQKVLGLAGPATAMGSVWVLLTILRFATLLRERNSVLKRFRSYVDPKLVNYVLEHPDEHVLAGTVRDMSVVFTDLEGFTTLSEALKEKTVPMLSDYMGEMVPLIRSHNGYVNKFLGDGIMFFFNPPCAPDVDHGADAVMAVLDMQRAMNPFNDKLKSQGLPTLNMRVGIVSGEMVVGDAGPASGSDYTVLGDNVNLASRLEGANKATGTNTMIHWKTKELLGDRFLCRPIGRLMVKGKTEGVMTYEPLGPTILADDRQRKILECSEKIVNAYFSADFDACIAACEAMDTELGPTKYTKLYRKEAEHRKEEFAKDGLDPKTFSGVITLSEK